MGSELRTAKGDARAAKARGGRAAGGAGAAAAASAAAPAAPEAAVEEEEILEEGADGVIEVKKRPVGRPPKAVNDPLPAKKYSILFEAVGVLLAQTAEGSENRRDQLHGGFSQPPWARYRQRLSKIMSDSEYTDEPSGITYNKNKEISQWVRMGWAVSSSRAQPYSSKLLSQVAPSDPFPPP